MKMCSSKTVLIVKMYENESLYPPGQVIKGREVALHDQGEGYQQYKTFYTCHCYINCKSSTDYRLDHCN